MLNQNERSPLSVAEQVASIYSGTGGYLDRIKVERVQDFLETLMGRLKSENGDLMGRIDDGQLSDEDEEALGEAIAEMVDDFGPDFDEEGQPLEEGESDRVKSGEEREKPGRTEEEAEKEADAEAEGEEAERTVAEAERETEGSDDGDSADDSEKTEEVTA
jgi:F-type H+-transporting ATPase subunit alpha